MRQATLLGLLTCLLLGGIAWAEAPMTEAPAALGAAARTEANVVTVNGRPTVLLWARGLQSLQEVDQYAASGLNTAYILIVDTTEEQLARASSLASAAEQRGLLVVAALAPASLRDEAGNPIPIDPRSDSYAAAVHEFVNAAAERMRTHPRLIAWSVEAVPPDRVAEGDEGFRAYLDGYASLSALNQSWGTEFNAWTEVSTGGVRDIDATRPGGIGRASVDYAYYRETLYADALSLWASAISQADPGRLVFASSLPDYRSIISVREDYHGLVLNTYPSLAEVDPQTHNVHAIDIGRRGNRFAVVATLEVRAETSPDTVARWVNGALLHGATGVAFSNWSAVSGSEQLQALIRQTGDAIREGGNFPAEPMARVAVLYQPIAGGATRNGRGLYGYLDGVTPEEPTNLFAVARRGSRFGQIDVLSISALGDADLTQYGTIIAPMVLDLREPNQVKLQNYVLQGGALVADGGIGMYQAGGTVGTVPPLLQELFGVRYLGLADRLAQEQGEPDYRGQPGERGQTGIVVPSGPGQPGLENNAGLAWLAGALEELLGRPDMEARLGTAFTQAEGAGLRVRQLGRGFAVYAPTFLYQTWSPTEPSFVSFHEEILSSRFDVEVVQPMGLWPAVSVAVYRDWSIAVASPNGAPAAVDAYDAANQMYWVPFGGMLLANPNEENRIELLFPGAPLAVAEPVPIFLRPMESGAVVGASVVSYDSHRVELQVYGGGAQANVGREGVEFSGGAPTQVQVEIRDGAYGIASGSIHRVVLEEAWGGGRRTAQAVMPNPETGALVFHVPVRQARIVVEPAPETVAE